MAHPLPNSAHGDKAISSKRPGTAAFRSVNKRMSLAETELAGWGGRIRISASGIAAGLATASAERVVAGGKSIEVARVRITEAGRRALKGTGR